MAVHTLASGDLKGPPRDEVPVGVSWDGTAVQGGNSGMERRDVRGSATEPVLAILCVWWGIVVFLVRALEVVKGWKCSVTSQEC